MRKSNTSPAKRLRQRRVSNAARAAAATRKEAAKRVDGKGSLRVSAAVETALRKEVLRVDAILRNRAVVVEEKNDTIALPPEASVLKGTEPAL